jgi:hypothetical protein
MFRVPVPSPLLTVKMLEGNGSVRELENKGEVTVFQEKLYIVVAESMIW